MRFTADESVHFGLTLALRSAGHDVIAISEVHPGSPDSLVAEQALAQARILITEDRDFGRLVFAERQAASGVIYLRYQPARRTELIATLFAVLEEFGQGLEDMFVVVQPGRRRTNQLPRP